MGRDGVKLVTLLYLEEDAECVDRLLREQEVDAYSRLAVEGHGGGVAGGWYGEEAPYRSRLVMAYLPAAAAGRLLQAVTDCRGLTDPRHPIRAFQMPVEMAAACGCDPIDTPQEDR